MIDKIRKTREYLDYLEEHYNNVQKAWALLQEKCKDMRFVYDDWCWGVIDADVKRHDESKLSQEEFVPYRINFFPGVDEIHTKKAKEAFKLAWDHHKKENNHHWETWVSLTNQTGSLSSMYGDVYVALNVIDWVAMGMKMGDTAKEYYEINKATIKIPDWAEEMMYEIFKRIY